ncbi:MAG: TetR/AcrR family transcriptional regulator [Propionibacteriaceae bacterium]|nr:TetR/AcrR family transcriptional regulator [Propionibacteriaceae bacterium]
MSTRPVRPRRASSNVVERLLDAADTYFFIEGVLATPIDVILRAAEASPPSLYKHFGSKDGLITAALRRRLAVWDAVWAAEIAASDGPLERVLAVYPAMRRYQRHHLPEKWCAFSGTRAAIAVRSEALQAVLDEETALLRNRHGELVAELGLGEAASKRLARQLVVVYNGQLAQMLRDPYEEAIEESEATARTLVSMALAQRTDERTAERSAEG